MMNALAEVAASVEQRAAADAIHALRPVWTGKVQTPTTPPMASSATSPPPMQPGLAAASPVSPPMTSFSLNDAFITAASSGQPQESLMAQHLLQRDALAAQQQQVPHQQQQQQQQPQQQPGPSRNCYTCLSAGHVAKDCPQPTAWQPSGRGSCLGQGLAAFQPNMQQRMAIIAQQQQGIPIGGSIVITDAAFAALMSSTTAPNAGLPQSGHYFFTILIGDCCA